MTDEHARAYRLAQAEAIARTTINSIEQIAKATAAGRHGEAMAIGIGTAARLTSMRSEPPTFDPVALNVIGRCVARIMIDAMKPPPGWTTKGWRRRLRRGWVYPHKPTPLTRNNFRLKFLEAP